MNTPSPLEEMTLVARDWANQAVAEMKTATLDDTGKLDSSLKAKIAKRNGNLYKISFSFQRYGMYREKGAGKGYGGTSKSGWLGKNNFRKFRKPESTGKQNTGNRTANEWFEPTINARIDTLADELEAVITSGVIDLVVRI